MQPVKSSVLLLFLLLFVNTSFSQGNAAREQTIAGRLLHDNGEFSCDRCVISLMMGGIRPIATTFADLSGRFAFRHVPRGPYVVHAVIDGFEEVNHPVDTGDGFGPETLVTIMLVRKPVFVQRGTGKNIVDVSEFTERYPKRAVDLFEKGLEDRKKNKVDQATKRLEDAVRIAPDFYHAHLELGLAYKHAGRFADAERHFLRAHELNDSNADPLVNLTSLYIDDNETNRAVETGEEAVKKNSRSAPAFFNLGMALYKAAMLDRAETALKRALELAPKMANVRLMLANVYLKLRNRDKLMEQLDGYLAENPKGEQRHVVEEMRHRVLSTVPEQMP